MESGDISTMKRQEIQDKLAAHREEIEALGICSLSVFGSVARNEATETSDVDLLVEFERPVGLFHFANVRRELAEFLGCPVDLATVSALREEMRKEILEETVSAF